MSQPLSVFMGSAAKATIAEHGWQDAPFRTLVGASGGPKWLILSEMDQVLASQLLTHTSRPMTLLGSSIGTW
ncbi:MAG: patatin-like phospholipase family protein, partial [Luminiphilus sp.]|nr:patatin-like phospholipase family protein [Luminiphilus sp.]